MESSSNNKKDSSSKKMDNMNNKKKDILQFPNFSNMDNMMQNPTMEIKDIPKNDKINIPDNIQKPVINKDFTMNSNMLNPNFQKETIENIMNQQNMLMAQINRIDNNQNMIMNNQNIIMNNQNNINNALLYIINSINNFHLLDNYNQNNQGSFPQSKGRSNSRSNSMDYNNNKIEKTIVVLFRNNDYHLMEVQCNLEDKASDVIRRYRKKTRKENFEERDQIFIFNGRKIKENKSLKQNGILNYSTIVVINLKGVKGAN